MRRRLMAIAAVVCGALALVDFAARWDASATPLGKPVSVPSSLVVQGHSLFESSCAACHGISAQGIRGRAPSLHGVGALAADFYLETGRMPLPSPKAQPLRTSPAFPQSKIKALIAYVASFGGPEIPVVHPRQGSLAEGQRLFGLDCAGCHTIQGQGGIVTGAIVPSLNEATPTQIGEAIRIGPYVMPRFSEGELLHSGGELARTLHPQHPAPRQPWRLGYRADRPDTRGNGRLAFGCCGAAVDRKAARRAHQRGARESSTCGWRRMSRIWRMIVMLWVWRTGGLRAHRQQEPDVDPSERHTGAPAWAERVVALLLLLVPVAALAFVALFTLHPNTQSARPDAWGHARAARGGTCPRRALACAAGDEGRAAPSARRPGGCS